MPDLPALAHELHAAMAAHVVEGANDAVAVARQEQRDSAEIVGQQIARRRHVARQPDAVPRRSEHRVARLRRSITTVVTNGVLMRNTVA